MMAETTLTNTGDGFAVSTPWVNNIIAGETYTIIYNGVSYTSPAVDLGMQIDLPGATILGDASMFGNDFTGGNPNAPFCILCVPNAYASNVGFSAVMADKNGLTEITVAILGPGEKVHKLDSKFIDWPDWYPEIIAEDANTYSGSVTSTQFGDNY